MFPWGRGARDYHSSGIGRQRLLLRQRRQFVAVSSAGWGARASKQTRPNPARSQTLEQTAASGARAGWGARAPRKNGPNRGEERTLEQIGGFGPRARVGAPVRQGKIAQTVVKSERSSRPLRLGGVSV